MGNKMDVCRTRNERTELRQIGEKKRSGLLNGVKLQIRETAWKCDMGRKADGVTWWRVEREGKKKDRMPWRGGEQS